MRPRERRETSEQDLFRSRLDQIIDMKHALVKLGQAIDWRFLEERFGAVYTDKPGQPPLPTRLMVGLAILKHTLRATGDQRAGSVPLAARDFFCSGLRFGNVGYGLYSGARRRTGLVARATSISRRCAFHQTFPTQSPDWSISN